LEATSNLLKDQRVQCRLDSHRIEYHRGIGLRCEMNGASSLRALGVSELEERIYRHMLRSAPSTARELSGAMQLPMRPLQLALVQLQDLGLVTKSPERVERYLVAAPDMALESLYLQRSAELRQARTVISVLEKESKSSRRQESQQHLVEVIKTPQAARQAFDQMQRAAQSEVVWFVRPPMLVSRLDQPMELEQALQRNAQARGVKYRSIVDEPFLELPGAAQRVKQDMEAGEDVRMVSSLPLKMALADRKVALIPLNPEETESQVLLVRSSALLDALYALFEVLWESATSLAASDSTRRRSRNAQLAAAVGADDFLNLMVAGLPDKSIATKLQISSRTLTRRLSDLMELLGAKSRFQAGWIAAQKLGRRR
jgi:sugar-specific transcriptional regulator TrmB